MSDQLLTEEEAQGIIEIRRLLDEAYAHYFKLSDGHCKSSEGHISLDFGTYFDRQGEPGLGLKSLTIYSYVLGPCRLHDFGTVKDALTTVRRWHAEELARDYSEDRFIPVEKLQNGDESE